MTRRALALASIALTLALCATALAEPPAPPNQRAPAPRLEVTEAQAQFVERMNAAFDGRGATRTYIMTDRPIYRPGEVIWVQSWNLRARDLTPVADKALTVYRLYDPRGRQVASRNVTTGTGVAWHDLDIPESAAGGAWTVQVAFPDGTIDERVVYVSGALGKAQLLKELEFLGTSWAPGETVKAAVSIRRKTGEPLANARLTVEARFAGRNAVTSEVTTDAEGHARIQVEVPRDLDGTDAVLNVIAEDGGRRESILEAIPISGRSLEVGVFPEGGDLVQGLPSRVYFDAVRPDGEPADVWGLVLDDTNHVAAEFRTSLYGMGRFEFTPEPGRRYRMKIYTPAGIKEAIPLPEARPRGCVLRSVDDVDGALPTIRLAVRCTDARDVLVVGAQRETIFDRARVHVEPGAPTLVQLDPGASLAHSQGVARLTLLADDLQPLAERLVYRNRGRELALHLEADKKRYGPREPVTLTVKATTPDGAPVSTALALAVVDKRTHELADDDSGHLLSRIYLEHEVPGEVYKPRRYFDRDNPDAGRALELLLGTRGYRRFEAVSIILVDTDRDGIIDLRDRCPDKPEDLDGFEDEDGCFDDQDDDGDGVPQSRDVCPREKGPPDRLGCRTMPPDPDADGIVNDLDLCPVDPEDKDGFEDEDGCPDPDNDHDAILDINDRCPNEPEHYNGYEDEDGCPDAPRILITSDVQLVPSGAEPPPGPVRDRRQAPELDGRPVRIPVAAPGSPPPPDPGPPAARPEGDSQKVVLSHSEIRILEKIYFDPGSAVLKKASWPILDEVAAVLKSYPAIRLLHLEGHTDDRGAEKPNQVLGQRRADAVRNYLISKGIEADRLKAVSWGELRPIDQNTTREGRLRNNRVEFQLVEIVGAMRPVPVPAIARVFPIPKVRPRKPTDPRDDFRDTLLWAPNLQTDEDGLAHVTFPLSDALTTFEARAEGAGGGEAGEGTLDLTSSLPFSLDLQAPAEVASGDVMELVAVLANEGTTASTVELTSTFGPLFHVKHPARQRVALAPGERKTVTLAVEAGAVTGTATFEVRATASGLDDRVEGTVRVVAAGFPAKAGQSGMLAEGVPTEVTIDLPTMTPGSLDAELRLMPSQVAVVLDSLAGMLQTPGGCFEQTSASNYPNLMVLRVLSEAGAVDPKLVAGARARLAIGYERLTGYEVPGGGFEWWGKSPAHETLTAYGLMQFMDMEAVYAVDTRLIQRTAAWLRSRRDGKGSYLASGQGLDRFGANSGVVRDAYIAWALSRTWAGNDKAEIDAAVERASSSNDPYVLALTTLILQRNAGQEEAARTAARRLAAMQAPSGEFPDAASTIVGSGGIWKTVETTGLAALALSNAEGYEAPFARAVQWLFVQRAAGGGWGTTQATVLALLAIEARAKRGPLVEEDGELKVEVDGKTIKTLTMPRTSLRPVVVADLARHLRTGTNTVRLTLTGTTAAPFGLDVRYTTRSPLSSPDAHVLLETALSAQKVRAGGTVRLSAEVTNTEDVAIPMTMVELGVPAGLQVPRAQLDALKDKGLVGHVEVHPRTIVLYLDGMGPRQKLPLTLDLQASLPGTWEGPASAAWRYYQPARSWAAPLSITITP